MSLLVEAEAALRRWRSQNATLPLPRVSVHLANHDRPIYFNGLAVASADGASYAVSGSGFPFPIHVIRDDDVERIVIGPIDAAAVGFRPPADEVR